MSDSTSSVPTPGQTEPALTDVAEVVEAAETPESAQAAESSQAPAAPEPDEAVATAEVTEAPAAPEPAEEVATAEVTEAPAAPEPDEAVATAEVTEAAPVPAPSPEPALAAPMPGPRPAAPSPAVLAGRLQAAATPGVRSSEFGRVADDGTVYVRTPEGEREVGSYPGATPEEALAYFTRKYDEANAQADLLYQRVTQTDLSGKEATEGLAKLRETMTDLRAVGDLVALAAKVENVATAVEARRTLEAAERAQQREVAKARRLEIVEAAEAIAAQPEEKIQWKSSSAQMRTLLDQWKAAQHDGPKLDRESEQSLWHRLSSARNSFDKLRRVHFAQLGSAQTQAKSEKEKLVAEAEELAKSTEWGPTAGAFKRLMDRWRQAGRASRSDDDALWEKFKAAQDRFFQAKDSVVAQENSEFTANLKTKEELLVQAQALLPITNLDAAKSALRAIQDKWDAAGKVPRADMERIEKAMRRVESAVREAEDRKWQQSNPEVTARAQSLVTQLEAACEGLRKDLAKAQASGDARKVSKAKEALEAREAWLAQARAALG